MTDDDLQAELDGMIDTADYRPEYLPIDTAEPIVAEASTVYEAMVLVARWQDWYAAHDLAAKLLDHLPTVPHYGRRYGFFNEHRMGVILETYRRSAAVLAERNAAIVA